MSDNKDRVIRVVSALIEAQRVYTSLVFDEVESGSPRPAATPQQIAGLERKLERALPISVRTFLSVYNGIDAFHADGVLLGTEDHASTWVVKRIAELDSNWQDVEPNPFEARSLPLMIGPDIQHFLMISNDRTNEEGEPLLVEYDLSAEVRTYPDIYSFIEKELDTLERMIDRQLHGDRI